MERSWRAPWRLQWVLMWYVFVRNCCDGYIKSSGLLFYEYFIIKFKKEGKKEKEKEKVPAKADRPMRG